MSARPSGAVPAAGRPRWQVWAWWAGLTAFVAIAAVAAASHRHELSGASQLLARVSPVKLTVAVALEAASFLALASLQRWLLRRAVVRPGLGTMTAFVLAANAMAGVIPAGSALSVAWAIRQLRRRQIGLALGVAMLAVSGALSALTLASLLAVGALVANPAGPAPGLRAVILVSAAVLATVTVSAVALTRSSAARGVMRHAGNRVAGNRPALRRLGKLLSEVLHQAESIQPGLRHWGRPFALASLNWVCDAAALTACLWALDIDVPWRGVLVAYGLTQISISLRLTPGSVGIAEASLGALLVVQGLRADQAIAAALLYRIVSFWMPQPVGWASWLRLTLHSPHGPAAR
ncbi:YbhN family protein [Streptomyces sp. H51]|uniref:lysylphosphatidylglycerol synthase transmembrane domain-containing protein n=1 Tax=Streptomyces sp. H51 TaxID=3111770 RepID=UPI002D767A1A|nr:YbhN family protein [Streptomyces sp. H51]